MRAPPAAVWRVASAPRWQAFHALVALLAAFSSGLCLWQVACRYLQNSTDLLFSSAQGLAFDALAGITLCGLCLAAARWGWRSSVQPPGRLLWTGSQWRFQPEGHAVPPTGSVRLDAMLDTGSWMLVRLRPDAEPKGQSREDRWLSLEGPSEGQAGALTQWAAFRAAVYSAASRSHGAATPQPSPLE